MSEFDRAPREYRSPPQCDLQHKIPERKVWTRETPTVKDRHLFGSAFFLGAVAGALATTVLALLLIFLGSAPGAY